jgi:uncharacterized protein YndB with AHSA1/START domain
MAVPTLTKTSISLSRTISATAERLYTAFSSRDELNRWFCNNSFMQAQENGAYVFIWNAEQYTATGIVKALEENKSISMTWRGTWKGESEADDSEIAIRFEENGGETIVTVTHSDITEEAKEGYETQWNNRLDDLKSYVETGALPNIVNRVIIGIFPGPVSQSRLDELGLEAQQAVLVTNVIPDMGAEKAGIKEQDVIVALDGTDISPQQPMNVIAQSKKPGEKVDVTLYRGDEKMTLTMELSAYPVPDIPETFEALADSIAEQYEQTFKDLSALFEGVSEEEAGNPPAEGEWGAKLVLAHLIYSENWLQDGIGGRITGGQPQHWSGNNNDRLQAIVDVYPNTQDLLDLLRREYDETLSLYRNFPEDTTAANKGHLWGEAFAINGWVQHARGHFSQIEAAIEAAKA